MHKHFYDHLINLEQVRESLNQLEMHDHERQELYELAHSHIHHAIMDEILSQLSDADKKIFLDHLTNDDHDQVWEHLNAKIERIEQRIQATANQLVQELHQDIYETKKV